MGDLILSAGLFTGEPVEEFIVHNQPELDAWEQRRQEAELRGEPFTEKKPPVRGVYWSILPIDGDIDAEYQKKRGMNEQTLSFRPVERDDKRTIEWDAVRVSLASDRELAALRWLCRQFIRGWRGMEMEHSDGRREALPFTEKTLDKLAALPQIIRPVVERGYALNRIREDIVEGNSETSSAGNATQT